MQQSFADAAAMVAALRPDRPVTCYRPQVLADRARAFVTGFPGEVLYAVKCNPDPLVLQALWDGGIRHFDTASLAEIETVRRQFPEAGCYFMHPVKAREAIRTAYERHGLRHFVVDHADELEKLWDCTGHAGDLVVMVRLATARGAAVYDLGGKFGCSVEQGAALMRAAAARGLRVGLCFHVGSQCMTPTSYLAACTLARQCLDRAEVAPAVIDVGGGFPTSYVGPQPPPLDDFFQAIRAGLDLIAPPADCQVWCEPGRGMVAAGASIVVRVELRRDDHLYLNDGVYGSLCDLKFPGIHLPMRIIRPGGQATAPLRPFSLFGPTCDCYDQLPGPYMLPADIREGDWIEIGQAGAYTGVTRTGFNGFHADETVVVRDGAFLPEPAMRPPEPAHIAA
ncbi:type III PLP-dependent enzyme [Oleisolibacter albus]|uniref:type III PLP-dependent enzyme n=1 Tax=Oleisolibacter albus TaxID=2171757 RepID=UPI000DF129A5|nr:type III PLP-dependent enzyme [Oleisolibacter albus]